MDTIQLKTELHQLIDRVNDNTILQALYDVLVHGRKKSTVDFWEALTANQKQDILDGIAELERGEKFDYNDIVAKYR